MHFFTVWNVRRHRRTIGLILIGVMLAFFIILQPERFLFFLFDHKETALTRGNPAENKVALTFNISWGDEKVHSILNVLKKEKITATFFVSGEWAERHPHILEKITEEKHDVAMLGYRYQNYLDTDEEQIRKDLLYAKEIFRKLGYDQVTYFRPPEGTLNKSMIDLANRLNLEVIYWSVRGHDEENPGIEAIAKNVIKNIKSGDIIFLHATDEAKETAQALEAIIPEIKKKKLAFVSVSELFTGVEVKEN